MWNDTTMYVQSPAKTSAVLDWLEVLSGAGLVLFILGHSLFVASVLFGAATFDGLAGFFESTGLAQVGGPLIGSVFLLHFILAARKIPFRTEQQKTLWAHARLMRHEDTWLWLVQAITGMLILFMGSIHMWIILNDLPITATKSVALAHSGLWLWFYLVFLFCVAMHVASGIYRAGVKWGYIRRDNRAKAKKALYILAGALVFLDLVSLIRFYFLSV
ncbi:MAG: succinate dehydrogenase/fumarate reductase cytochrome b subunit [Desulfoplanes sp.]|jgi:fumarate reductase subunit C|nr:succinate dehydrogenase/fumarate reductase cytochrome b subunit [Desulfoplanes sp.]MDD4649577.1 succinate dehydrogenase/fumarate reductase cytochrome b subunit [Desulfoplanes sp.]